MIDFLFRKKAETLAVDISGGWIKTAELVPAFNRQGNIEIAAWPLNNDAARFLRGLAVKRPDTIISCLSRQSVTVRFLRLPSSDESEITAMLSMQAAKDLPLSNEDLITGHKILEVDNSGYSRLLFAIAQKSVFDRHVNILKSAGLLPQTVSISTEAVLNCFLKTSYGLDAQAQAGLYMLLDIDYSSAELLICRSKTILFSRAFGLGASSLHKSAGPANAQAWAGALAGEIGRSNAVFQKDKTSDIKNRSVSKVFLLGAPLKFSGAVLEKLVQELSVKVEWVDVFNRAKASQEAVSKGRYITEPISYTSVIGMALAEKTLAVNFLPPQIQERNLRRKRQAELIFTLSLAGLAIMCILAVFGARFYYKWAYIKHLNKQQANIEKAAKKARLTTEMFYAAKEQSGQQNSAIEIFTGVFQAAPEGTNLLSFSLSPERAVMLRGSCGQTAGVFELAVALEKTGHFKNVKVIFANKRKTEASEFVDFQISCSARQL